MNLNINKTAILVIDYNDPNSFEDFKKFLFNIISDKNLIKLPLFLRFLLAKFIIFRNKKTIKAKFLDFKDKPNSKDSSKYLAANLERELSFYSDFKVFNVGNYQNNLLEIVSKLSDYQIQNIILLPCFPQYFAAKLKTFLANFDEIYHRKNNLGDQKINLTKICCYKNHFFFINSYSDAIRRIIENKISNNDLDKIEILFIADNFLNNSAKEEDPYFYQINLSAKLIIDNLNEKYSQKNISFDYKICSKLLDLFTKLDIDQELKITKLNKKIPILVPISFITDRFNLVKNLNRDYNEICNKLNIKKYFMTPLIGSDQEFIKGLAELCLAAHNDQKKSLKSNYFFCHQFERCPQQYKECQNN